MAAIAVVPGPQIPGGLQLRARPRPQARHHRPPGHPGLRHRPRQRRLPRPTRHRQDPPGHRPGHPRLPRRAPGPVATASEWVDRLAAAHHAGRLQDELRRLTRYALLVVDEVSYIPFEPEAANLFFQLVSSPYERASLIVTSNKSFGRWGEVFGDDVVAAAMIDRLVHHAEVIALKGDSYRLKDRDLGRVPTTGTEDNQPCRGSAFSCRQGVTFRLPLTF
jgi:IstB-like ATP binding protein